MYPILFSIGPVTVYTFGFFASLGFLMATFVIWRIAREHEWNMEPVFDTILLSTLAGIIGARALYVFLHPYEFEGNLAKMVLILKYPGLSFLGGLILGSLVCWLWLRRHRLPIRAVADALSFGVLVAHLSGSLGCFFNACMYGSITYLPWGVVVPGLLGRRHPVALYFVLLDLLILFWLWRLSTQHIKPGVSTSWFFVLLLGSVALVELWRGDSVYWFSLPAQGLIAVALGVVATVVLYKATGHTVRGDWHILVHRAQAMARGELRLNLSPGAFAGLVVKPWRECTIVFRQWQLRSRWRRKRRREHTL